MDKVICVISSENNWVIIHKNDVSIHHWLELELLVKEYLHKKLYIHQTPKWILDLFELHKQNNSSGYSNSNVLLIYDYIMEY